MPQAAYNAYSWTEIRKMAIFAFVPLSEIFSMILINSSLKYRKKIEPHGEKKMMQRKINAHHTRSNGEEEEEEV